MKRNVEKERQRKAELAKKELEERKKKLAMEQKKQEVTGMLGARMSTMRGAAAKDRLKKMLE